MSVRVSVIIPTYKAAPWLEATLESVVRQTFPAHDLELIVIDDASPDDSVAIARKFLQQHSLNSRVVQREMNSGVAATRNAGWKLANGEWIQFLDQDDLLAPHKIELQARCATEAPADVAVVYSNWQYFLLEDGKWQASGALNAPFVDDDPILQILEQWSFGYVGPALIRKSFLRLIGGFEEKPNIGEDTELMLRLAMAGGGFREARSEQAAFFYRQSPGSLWRAYAKDRVAMRNLLKTYRRVDEFLRRQSPNGALSKRARKALARRYSASADYYLENDPGSFQDLIGWFAELGVRYPPDATRGMRFLASLVGYERGLRLRSAYRMARRRVGWP